MKTFNKHLKSIFLHFITMHFELMQCGYILQKMLVREFVASGSDVL